MFAKLSKFKLPAMPKGALCLSWGEWRRRSVEDSDMLLCITIGWFQITCLKGMEMDDLAELIDTLAVEKGRLELILKNRGIDV